jgi:hypothetical protein
VLQKRRTSSSVVQDAEQRPKHLPPTGLRRPRRVTASDGTMGRGAPSQGTRLPAATRGGGTRGRHQGRRARGRCATRSIPRPRRRASWEGGIESCHVGSPAAGSGHRGPASPHCAVEEKVGCGRRPVREGGRGVSCGGAKEAGRPRRQIQRRWRLLSPRARPCLLEVNDPRARPRGRRLSAFAGLDLVTGRRRGGGGEGARRGWSRRRAWRGWSRRRVKGVGGAWSRRGG